MVKIKLLKKTFVQIVAVLLSFIFLFIGYGSITSKYAKSKAEEVCTSIPVGTSSDTAVKTIQQIDTDPKLILLSPNMISVGFRGAFLDRWFCNLSIDQDRVISGEIRLLD
jgi:hypothetical protein